ncbi:hypothetical protein [Streptomyces sp. NPDC047981]|uniref:hypothetical protein n=1 Tax=Streptomyces sp. NPDC047981 TaxID=3154610 RepID=UPI00341D5D43
MDVTLSAAEHGLGVGRLLPLLAPSSRLVLGREAVFCVGPDIAPVDAMERAVATVRRTLPLLLRGAPAALAAREDVLSVVRELVDITARDRSSIDILGRITFDGMHVTVSVGEKRDPLPAPEVEPGLYLVHRLADEVGQYRGDEDGYVVWAAVNASRR